jgi:hypothetical protein
MFKTLKWIRIVFVRPYGDLSIFGDMCDCNLYDRRFLEFFTLKSIILGQSHKFAKMCILDYLLTRTSNTKRNT